MFVPPLPDSTTKTINWVLMRATWLCAAWISSWLVAKPLRKPCSGASSTSLRTLMSRVSVQRRTPQLQQRKYRLTVGESMNEEALFHFLDKVQAEIDRVIGQTRQPTMADRPSMPFTDAVIHEIQRLGNVVPLNGLRMAAKDMTLGGYVIPKVLLLLHL